MTKPLKMTRLLLVVKEPRESEVRIFTQICTLKIKEEHLADSYFLWFEHRYNNDDNELIKEWKLALRFNVDNKRSGFGSCIVEPLQSTDYFTVELSEPKRTSRKELETLKQKFHCYYYERLPDGQLVNCLFKTFLG
jgi:hypothetical protein